MRTAHPIHLQIVFIREPDGWVAQVLEHDFAAQGQTTSAALRNLVHTIASHLYVARRQGTADLESVLQSVQPAPPEYWKLFEEAAKHRMQADEVTPPGMPPMFMIKAVANQEATAV